VSHHPERLSSDPDRRPIKSRSVMVVRIVSDRDAQGHVGMALKAAAERVKQAIERI
jgi:hypothetical protein